MYSPGFAAGVAGPPSSHARTPLKSCRAAWMFGFVVRRCQAFVPSFSARDRKGMSLRCDAAKPPTNTRNAADAMKSVRGISSFLEGDRSTPRCGVAAHGVDELA